MESVNPTTIEALDAEGTGTRVVFEWTGDRFRHTIYSVCLGETSMLAESIEGDAQSHWPPSPPFQQVLKQSHDSSGEVLYMMGMAGRSLWSGSIMTSNDLRWTLVGFALSCRYHAHPDWLGAIYNIAPGVEADQSITESEVTLTTESGLEYRMAPAGLGNTLATEELPTSSIRLQESRIRIEAEPTFHLTTPTTNSWAYRINLTRPYWMTRTDGEDG